MQSGPQGENGLCAGSAQLVAGCAGRLTVQRPCTPGLGCDHLMRLLPPALRGLKALPLPFPVSAPHYVSTLSVLLARPACPAQGMREAVSANLHSQLLSLSSALHAILQQQRDPMPAAALLCELAAERQREADAEAAAQRQREEARVRPGGRGLAFAFGSGAAAEQQAAASEQGTPADPSSSSGSGGSGDEGLRAGASGVGAAAGPALSVAELAAAFREQAGFCLRVAPSSIQHAESGNGLWIEGGAGVGQVRKGGDVGVDGERRGRGVG